MANTRTKLGWSTHIVFITSTFSRVNQTYSLLFILFCTGYTRRIVTNMNTLSWHGIDEKVCHSLLIYPVILKICQQMSLESEQTWNWPNRATVPMYVLGQWTNVELYARKWSRSLHVRDWDPVWHKFHQLDQSSNQMITCIPSSSLYEQLSFYPLYTILIWLETDQRKNSVRVFFTCLLCLLLHVYHLANKVLPQRKKGNMLFFPILRVRQTMMFGWDMVLLRPNSIWDFLCLFPYTYSILSSPQTHSRVRSRSKKPWCVCTSGRMWAKLSYYQKRNRKLTWVAF